MLACGESPVVSQTWLIEVLVQFLCRDLDVLTEIYRKLFAKAVDDKIKQVLFFYLAVCLFCLHTFSKKTLSIKRCNRLSLDKSTASAVYSLLDAVDSESIAF